MSFFFFKLTTEFKGFSPGVGLAKIVEIKATKAKKYISKIFFLNFKIPGKTKISFKCAD